MQVALQIADSHLGVSVSFCLDHRYAPGSLGSDSKVAQQALLQLETTDSKEAAGADHDVPPELPQGFCHAFATRFQVRSRHSPRPPGQQPVERGRKPQGVPWSAWTESSDSDLQATTTNETAPNTVEHSVNLMLPNGINFEYGSWYQTSVRISDGICWSDWSEPSTPVKVFVAPPKVDRPDLDELAVDRSSGGNNIKVRWTPLRAHGGLRLVEYALFVREVLHDRSELCPRHIATLILGQAAKPSNNADNDAVQKRELMMYELRDLRQDVTYIFTLAARYPHIGPREFDDALNSAPTSLRPVCAPLPVPCQLSLPPERLRRMQGMRCVLLKWSFQGLPPQDADPEAHNEKLERQYDLQALPEGAKDNEWVLCKNVAKTKIDGAVAWFVKDVPGHTLRSRFRLWERDTGRFGRTSPLMLSLIEPVQKVGALCVIAESAAQIVLRAPMDARHGSHEFVCRYQVRFKPEQMGGDWTELPIVMLWHRQNDHLASLDVPVDSQGAVITGLPTKEQALNSLKAVSFNAPAPRRLSSEKIRTAEEVQAAASEQVGDEGNVVRTPQFPTIPLATVGPAGDVHRQRCLLAVIREEDGLQLNQAYTFSVRVGDLYRLSDWSEPSIAVKLAVPAPVLDASLSTDEARIRVSDVTDSSMTATWPQFIPSPQAGVPVHVEVEYLLTVAPQAPKRRLAGRGAEQEAPPQPHSQWLLSSTALQGSSLEELQGQTLRVAVIGLVPHTAYELRLSVRYARLGLRKWSEALSVVAWTKKQDAESRLVLENSREYSKTEDLSVLRKLVPVPLGASKFENRGFMKESPRSGMRAESPRNLHSPQALPPIDATDSSLAHLDANVPHPDVGEWMDVAHADAHRITGGNAVTAPGSMPVAAPAAADVIGTEEYPTRPADFVPFWRRDPMDGRPTMPPMPSAGHSAMQLDLVGRSAPFAPGAPAGADTSAIQIVPRPPNSERISGRGHRPLDLDRMAYPRRYIHE